MRKKLLHVGCGTKNNKPPREYAAYQEVRLDVNPAVAPDIIASIVSMPMIEDGTYDAVYASHILEHLHPHEVAMALTECCRVLKPGGELRVHVPDLQSIGGKIALDEAATVLFISEAGPVTPLDMIYGHAASIAKGNTWMAHKTGFSKSVLKAALVMAGFQKIECERGEQFDLKGVAYASEESSTESVPERPLRACMGEETSLRQCGETSEAREAQIAGV